MTSWMLFIPFMSLLSMLNLYCPLLNIWNMVIIIVLISLSTKSVVCVFYGSVYIDGFFSSLWVIVNCFFACLVIFIDCKRLNFSLAVHWIFCIPIASPGVCSVIQLSHLETVWSSLGLLLSFVGWDRSSLYSGLPFPHNWVPWQTAHELQGFSFLAEENLNYSLPFVNYRDCFL